MPSNYHRKSRADAARASHTKRPLGAQNHAAIELHLPVLKRSSYHVREISLTLREHAKDSLGNKLTTEELHFLMNPTGDTTSVTSLLEFLRYSSMILDKAFFFNGLMRLVHLETLGGHDLESRYTGIATHVAGFYDKDGETIRMGLRYSHDAFDNVSRQQVILATLVHEMLHAFFSIYGCDCGSCMADGRDCSALGETGHGTSWCNAMIAIQDCMAVDLGWDVSCDIEGSVRREMRTSDWEPAPRQLRRWRLEYLSSRPLGHEDDHDSDVASKRTGRRSLGDHRIEVDKQQWSRKKRNKSCRLM